MKAKVLKFHPKKCKGCRDCEVACSKIQFNSNEGGGKSAIRINEHKGKYTMHVCNQNGLCIDICPVGALERKSNGAVILDKKTCVGCQMCVGFCPEKAMRHHPDRLQPFKCISCGACVKACPEKALELVEVDVKEIMQVVEHGYKEFKSVVGPVDGQVHWKKYKTNNSEFKFDVEKFKAAHKVIAEYKFEKKPVKNGYANRTLLVNLSTNEILEKPVTEQMKNMFTGGKGFGLKLLRDAINPETKWDSPENALVFAHGPLCGSTQYPGSGKSLIVSLSPATNIPVDCNVGGFFGPYLKFAGFDALEIQGKAKKDVIVLIDGETSTVRIETAPMEETDTYLLSEQLTKIYANADDDKSRQLVSAVTSGSGGNISYFSCLNVSFWDIRRKVARIKQAGRGGLGRVFRDKKMKGIVVKAEKITGNDNNPADIEKMIQIGTKMHREISTLDSKQCCMRETGTGHLVEVMNAYDLLPTENFRFGQFPKASKINSEEFYKKWTQVIPDGCWHGCSLACAKAVDGFTLKTGPLKGKKVTVDGPEYETIGACSNMSLWDVDWIIEFNFYCDNYGLDTISSGTTTAFLMELFEYGILNKERTDGLELFFGNFYAVMELLHRIGKNDKTEFITTVAKGTRRIKDWVIRNGWGDAQLVNDIGMENKGLEYSQYVSKESLAQQGGYALTLKGPQHDEAWLIFMDMVNNHIPTFKDKAEALWYFPMWRTWFGLNGLCKLPWNDIEPENNPKTKEPAKVPEHVQNYVDFQNAVIGRKSTKDDIIAQSERVYNFQRLLNLWLGRGQRKDDWAPYRSIGPVTKMEYFSRQERYDSQLVNVLGYKEAEVEKMTVDAKIKLLYVYRRNMYEKLTDAVYYRRGWTPNGVPTLKKLKSLGIDDKELIKFVKAKIKKDDKAGLNNWGGKYDKGENPPTKEEKYWEKD